MKNETEIRYNCYGLVSAWMNIHKSDIKEGSSLSLTYNGKTTSYDNSNEISNALLAHILNEDKGTIDFAINGIIKEHFDII